MAADTLTLVEIAAFGGKDEDIVAALTTGTGANDIDFLHPGGGSVFLIIKNEVGSPITTTLVGVASGDTFNRATDVTITTAANEISIVNVPERGFTDKSTGKVNVTFTEDTTGFGVFKLVATPKR